MSARGPTQPRLLLPASGPVTAESSHGAYVGLDGVAFNDQNAFTGSDSHLQRGKVKLRACNSCRRRKIKCNGQRPRCRTCTRRRIVCDYDSDEDESESSGMARKRKHPQPENSNNPFEQVYRYLAHLPRGDADNMLSMIQTGADPEAVLQQWSDKSNIEWTIEPGTLPFASDDQDGEESYPEASIELMNHLRSAPDLDGWTNPTQIGNITNNPAEVLATPIHGENIPPHQLSETAIATTSAEPGSITSEFELDLLLQDTTTTSPMLEPDLGFCLYDTLPARKDSENG